MPGRPDASTLVAVTLAEMQGDLEAALQVTNEANVVGAAAVGDGAYPGAEDALVHGVIAAQSEVRELGFAQVGIGFNWAYASDADEHAFWTRLNRLGGPAFRRSLDWVGLDVYPETWGPRASGGDLSSSVRATIIDALGALRRLMGLAALPPTVPLHVCENGYPTGPGRTDAMQVTAMTAAITALNAHRARYLVTDYRWFDLRDADSANTSFESQYGLLRDDYTPKPAFAVFADLVSSLGAP